MKFEVVENSDQTLKAKAKLLLNFHEISPKLTPLTTIGVMWNPPSGFGADLARCEAIFSNDGLVCASGPIRNFAASKMKELKITHKPVAKFDFFPTSPKNIARAQKFDSLAYLGVHWDGPRHKQLLSDLARGGIINIYGPEAAWSHIREGYHGTIPFDGISAIHKLANHGIVLCLHRKEHILADAPSMRLFEAASAGCLIISDNIPFARRVFGNSIFTLPDEGCGAEFVGRVVGWARANPKEAQKMADASRAIFERHLSLDGLVVKLLKFGQEVLNNRHKKYLFDLPRVMGARIDLFLSPNIGGESMIREMIEVVNTQTHRNIRLLVSEGDMRVSGKSSFVLRSGIELVPIELGGEKLTSSLIASSLRSSYFAVLNTDTIWAPDHLATLKSTLELQENAEVALATSIQMLSDFDQIVPVNFKGDMGREITENRAINFNSLDDSLDYVNDSDLLMSRSDWLFRSSRFKDRIASSVEARVSKPDAAKTLLVSRSGRATVFRT